MTDNEHAIAAIRAHQARFDALLVIGLRLGFEYAGELADWLGLSDASPRGRTNRVKAGLHRLERDGFVERAGSVIGPRGRMRLRWRAATKFAPSNERAEHP